MKKLLFIITLLFTAFAFGQKNEFNLIKLDSTWGQEVLRFPARNMNYVGIGEVRFPPKGWLKPKHRNFWSYAYAWSLHVNRKITENELALNLVKYFNSLNKIEMDDRKNARYTFASVSKNKKIKSVTFFTGKVKIFDRFVTNKRIILNVKIESHYCKKEKRTVLLFKFSPKEFKYITWELLEKVKLKESVCD